MKVDYFTVPPGLRVFPCSHARNGREIRGCMCLDVADEHYDTSTHIFPHKAAKGGATTMRKK